MLIDSIVHRRTTPIIQHIGGLALGFAVGLVSLFSVTFCFADSPVIGSPNTTVNTTVEHRRALSEGQVNVIGWICNATEVAEMREDFGAIVGLRQSLLDALDLLADFKANTGARNLDRERVYLAMQTWLDQNASVNFSQGILQGSLLLNWPSGNQMPASLQKVLGRGGEDNPYGLKTLQQRAEQGETISMVVEKIERQQVSYINQDCYLPKDLQNALAKMDAEIRQVQTLKDRIITEINALPQQMVHPATVGAM